MPTPGFQIDVHDTRKLGTADEASANYTVGPLNVPVQDPTRIDLSSRPVTTENGEVLSVSGWLALAKDAYKDEETAGVRIYARNKIVGWTRDFEQPAASTISAAQELWRLAREHGVDVDALLVRLKGDELLAALEAYYATHNPGR